MFARVLNYAIASLVVAILSVGLPLRAGEEGEELLDKALEAKKDIQSLDDLVELIDLCQQAIDAGLEDPALAKELLASSLQQRATVYAQHLASLIQGRAADPALAQQYPKILAATQADLERAVENDPELIESYLLLGQISGFPGGDKDAGMEALDKAVEMADNHAETLVKALMLRASLREEAEDRL
ncbi:MAG: hypothetical protein AB7I37_26620, partial [Pirellulales bacterium]